MRDISRENPTFPTPQPESRPTRVRMLQAHNVANSWDNFYRSGHGPWTADGYVPSSSLSDSAAWMNEANASVPGGFKNILELGCGRGSDGVLLAEQFPAARVAAVDFSRDAVKDAEELAAERGIDKERLRFHAYDVLELPRPPVQMDLVWDNTVYHNARREGTNGDGLLRYRHLLRRVLPVGGYFLLVTGSTAQDSVVSNFPRVSL